MSGITFAKRLEERLATARHQEEHDTGIEHEAMRERSERVAVLERFGERLHREVVRPRASALARGLEAAFEQYRTPNGFYSYVRCAHTARFPATAKLGLGLEWDPSASEVWLVCSVEIIPVLMALPGDARLPLQWEGPDEAEAAGWIEERIMLFLEACLAIMRDPSYHQDRLRTDPVCGMRVSPGVAGETEFKEKKFFFCSSFCQQRFTQDPELYAAGRVSADE